MPQTPSSITILGTSVRMNLAMTAVVDDFLIRAANDERTEVAFVNADCLNIACVDKEYAQVLFDQDYILPDGIGVKIGAKFQGTAPVENINGTDLLPILCEKAAATGQSLFFLGAKPGVADTMKDKLIERFPGLNVAGVHHGYLEPSDTADVVAKINSSNADVLLVAFGAPRQEKWLHDNRNALTVPVRMGVGGLFDFFSGNVPRAPLWMRNNGLEWLFRLANEPRRLFKRYVMGNPLFIWRVTLDKLGLRQY